jgi:hypothetical protein
MLVWSLPSDSIATPPATWPNARPAMSLLLQIQAANSYLASLQPEARRDASAVQAAALHEAISRGGPDPGEKDMLIAAVGQGQWLPDDVARLVQALAAPRALVLQNFEALWQYGSSDMYTAIQSSEDAAANLLTERLMNLGLRKASEKSAAAAGAFLILATTPPEQVATVNNETLLETVRYFKRLLKSRSRGRETRPGDFILKLPDSPVELRQSHPAIYAAAFPDYPPCAPPWTQGALINLMARMPCRVTMGSRALPLGLGRQLMPSNMMQHMHQMPQMLQLQVQQQQQQQFQQLVPQLMQMMVGAMGGRPAHEADGALPGLQMLTGRPGGGGRPAREADGALPGLRLPPHRQADPGEAEVEVSMSEEEGAGGRGRGRACEGS